MEGPRRLPARHTRLSRTGRRGQTPTYTAAVSGRSRHTPCARGISSQRTLESVGVRQRQFLQHPRDLSAPPHPHPHPRGAGPPRARGETRVRRRENAPHQRAPGAPCPRGRRRESLLLRTPGLSLGTPTSRRRREPRRGRREGAGKKPEPESQSGEPGPEEKFS